VWPAARFLVIVSLAAAEQWRDSRERVMAARRVSVDGERAVSVLFELRDAVSGCLSGEAALAWWPRFDVLAANGVAGRDEPRGLIWRLAVRVAARVRAAGTWRANVESIPSPISPLLGAAFENMDEQAATVRATLDSFGLAQAQALFDELCAVPPDDEHRAQVEAMTITLADLDAATAPPP
jgi:hypothetical protein